MSTTRREILRKLATRAGFVRPDYHAIRDALAARGHDVAYQTVNAWFGGGRRPTQASQLALVELFEATSEEAVELFKASDDA